MLAAICPALTVNQLRTFVKHGQSNGLEASGAIIRPHGNRIYIDPVKFGPWLESKGLAER